MAEILITQFDGGQSDSEKEGIDGSFRRLQSIKIHEDPNMATLFMNPVKVSGTTVVGMLNWMEDGTPFDTNRWSYDASGNIYKETSAGTWTKDRAAATIGNGAAGQGLAIADDYLYYATSTTIGANGKLTLTPAYNDDIFSDGTRDLDQTGGGTGAADYVPQTTIASPEVATDKQTFTPTKDPIKSITIDVDVVGSGDWTLLVHDADDVLIGSKTIANGSMSTGDVTFTFSTALRVRIGNEYHFHVLSTVADGGVDTEDATDLEGAEYTILCGVLIASTAYHPMLLFYDLLCTGNENYLSVWDWVTYSPNELKLDPGYSVRSLTIVDEFIVIGCVTGSDIQGSEKARLFYWDGLQKGYNYSKDVPLGFVNALHNSKNRLMSILGDRGAIYIGTEPFQKVQELPLLKRRYTVEVKPGAITEWDGKTYIGYATSQDSTDVYQGVYEFGSADDTKPEVLTHVAIISTGTTQSQTLNIGLVKGIGKDLYIGWDDNGTYGVDKITSSGNPVASGEIESLIIDNGAPHKEKIFKGITVTMNAIAASHTITPKYKINRGSWVNMTATSTVGDTEVKRKVTGIRYKDLEVGVTVAATSIALPEITGIIIHYDPASEESDT